MRRGFTLTEILVSMSIMLMATLGLVSLFTTGLRSAQTTTTDTALSQQNAQGMRRIAETLREAMSISISNDGKTLTYQLPKMSPYVDDTTGERELVLPMQSDGVTRTFAITSGNLVDGSTGRILIQNVHATDPLPSSSQYNEAYKPFEFATIGATRAVQLNFITRDQVGPNVRYCRLKTTVVIRNQQ